MPLCSSQTTAGLPTSFAVQPDGNFVVLGRSAGPNGDQQYAIPSVDGGVTLEPTAYITTQQFDYPWSADPSLSSAVDRDGTIYGGFPHCRFRANCSDPGCRFQTTTSFCAPNDLLLVESRDGSASGANHGDIPIDPVTTGTMTSSRGWGCTAIGGWRAASARTHLLLRAQCEPPWWGHLYVEHLPSERRLYFFGRWRPKLGAKRTRCRDRCGLRAGSFPPTLARWLLTIFPQSSSTDVHSVRSRLHGRPIR